tara:strand:- start:202 stop:1128 length:927 start_codon:yes stop_codon:yes gene_type:complete
MTSLKLRIAVMNWWNEPDTKANNWFVEYMKSNFENVECVGVGDPQTDILFASVFGDKNRINSVPGRVKVLFSGESWSNKTYKEYTSEFIESKYDLILHFDETDPIRKRQRFPLWLLYVPRYNMNDINDNFITYVNEMRDINMNKGKVKFGVCVARHDPTGMRGSICNEIQKYGKVEYGGRWGNRDKPKIGGLREDKIKYLSGAIYSVCAESHAVSHYCSEKIFESFMGGNIPIYWSKDIIAEEEILKRESYCIYDIDEIEKMMKNNAEYKMKDIFTENAYNILRREYYDKLKSNLIKLLREKGYIHAL